MASAGAQLGGTSTESLAVAGLVSCSENSGAATEAHSATSQSGHQTEDGLLASTLVFRKDKIGVRAVASRVGVTRATSDSASQDSTLFNLQLRSKSSVSNRSPELSSASGHGLVEIFCKFQGGESSSLVGVGSAPPKVLEDDGL